MTSQGQCEALRDAVERMDNAGASARRALLIAEHAQANGDTARVETYTATAQRFAEQRRSAEREIRRLEGRNSPAVQRC